MTHHGLQCEGQIHHPCRLSLEDLRRLPAADQVADVGQLDPKRQGRAVRLSAVLDLLQVDPVVTHLGLHASRDDFHASIPLKPVRDRALIIYELQGEPLAERWGGPFRFFVPDHAACQLHEIDECANVKFLDRLELTVGKGFDNRPQDEVSHAKLHENPS